MDLHTAATPANLTRTSSGLYVPAQQASPITASSGFITDLTGVNLAGLGLRL